MQEFIQSVASRFGISPDSAKTATAGLLNLLKEKESSGEVQGLLSKLPGAEEVIDSAPSEGVSGGGFGNLGSLVGGKLGGAAGALAAFKSSGLEPSQVGSFVKMLIDFAKQKAGPEVVDKALEKVPDLKALLG
jgi:hypothetical protein